MSKTRLSGAEQIFVAAIELEPDERPALLDERCGTNDALRQEVERMLAAADASEDYFADLPGRVGISRLRDGREQTYEATPGQQFGQYRLTEQIGSGGMGAVWRAERSDGRFEGDVAVKLLTRLHNKAALQHFDREAHYLAKLSHPNITRLIDAGIGPDEVPYLILEYVEGEPIDEWCDARALGIDERLELLIQVADAVAHAHTRLVVHSDIKPSNVLVTPDGTVKLLDFGIASLLDDSAEGDGGAALTPEFAAPEQLAGERVSTATDVYALGMVLHLLLTGTSPRVIDKNTDLVTLRREARKDPTPLSDTVGNPPSIADPELRRRAADRGIGTNRFVKTLRGEIDPIVRKALAVDQDQRYRNASELAADLRRYLRQEPITALPHTFGYRTRKFVSRHRGSVLSAALTTVALIAALGVALQQMLIARAERDAAEYERMRTLASNEFYGILLEEMGSADRPLTALELLDRGAELLRSQYGAQQPFMGRIQFELSRRYGSIDEGGRRREFLELAEHSARESQDVDLLASVLCANSVDLLNEDAQAARTVADEALPLFAALRAPTVETRFQCVRMQARHAQADGNPARAIEILDAARHHAVPESARYRALITLDLATVNYRTGHFREAAQLLDEALAILRQGGRGNTETFHVMLGNKAAMLSRNGQIAEAIRIDEEIISRFSEAAWTGQRGTLQRRLLYAGNLERMGRVDEALAVADQARVDANDSGEPYLQAIAALTYARGLIEVDRLDEATRQLDDVEATLSSSQSVWRRQLARVDTLRATIARKEGRLDDARAILQPLIATRKQGEHALAPSTVAQLLAAAASIEHDAQSFLRAEELASEAIAIHQETALDPERSAHLGAVFVIRARSRYALGRYDEAITDLELAVVALGNGLGQENVETVETRNLLAIYRASR